MKTKIDTVAMSAYEHGRLKMQVWRGNRCHSYSAIPRDSNYRARAARLFQFALAYAARFGKEVM